VAIEPQLPAEWASLGFSIQWRVRLLSIKIDQIHRCLEASLKEGEPMTLVVCGTSHQLRRNQVLRVSTALASAADRKVKADIELQPSSSIN
jgi:trehalose/maltose hydrolase-like predicted phosphorylase